MRLKPAELVVKYKDRILAEYERKGAWHKVHSTLADTVPEIAGMSSAVFRRYALVMAELIKLDTMRYFPGPVIQQNEFEQVDKQINNQAELNIKINDAVGNLNEQLKHNVSVMVHQEQELEHLTQELYEQKTLNYELNRIVEKLSCTLDEQIMLKNQLNDQDLHIEVKQDDEK